MKAGNKTHFEIVHKIKNQGNCLGFSHLYRRRDLNPHGHYCPLDFKSNVSTDSTTSAWT